MMKLLHATPSTTNELAEPQQIWTSAVFGFAPNAVSAVSSGPELVFEYAVLYGPPLLPRSGFELCDRRSTLLQSCNL
jgi:hypothetical protein